MTLYSTEARARNMLKYMDFYHLQENAIVGYRTRCFQKSRL